MAARRSTYRATLAYDGRGFAGWARQAGQRTVEGRLLEILTSALGEPPPLAVAGRTDRGVSASGQVVSFKTSAPIDPAQVRAIIDREGAEEIAALEVAPAPRWFHAQYSARARRYVYLLDDDGQVPLARLDGLLFALTGRRCFSAFARDTPKNKTTVRTLHLATAQRVVVGGRAQLRFDFGADAFLRRQVRVMVATAVREALAGSPEDALVKLAAFGDRSATAPPAPPEGLTLAKVVY